MPDQRERSRGKWDEPLVRQPSCNEFRAATLLISLLLSAADELGQIGKKKKAGRESRKGEKSSLSLRQRLHIDQRGKPYQLVRLL